MNTETQTLSNNNKQYILSNDDIEFILSEVIQGIIGQMALLPSITDEESAERLNRTIISLSYFHSDFVKTALITREFPEILVKNAAKLLMAKKASLSKILEQIPELDQRESLSENIKTIDELCERLPKIESQFEERKRIIIP